MRDLAVLVADKNMESAIRILLNRHQALGIRPITADVFVHPRRDPGCVNYPQEVLAPLRDTYWYALVMFDHEGSGRELMPPLEIARHVNNRLRNAGWENRSQVIVLAPELEIWVWSASPHVATCLGWKDRSPDLRAWLESTGYWPQTAAKPQDPKAALEAALREIRRPRSSSIYAELASVVSLQGHREPAFVSFVDTLQKWFPRS